jgi:phosphoribosyl 1,2-cyclic phosphate phosphodiesterase
LKHSFGYIFVKDNNLRYGLPCLTAREAIIGKSFQIGSLKFEPLELDHQIITSTGFKISCGDSAVLSYCLDVKRIPEKSFEALQGTHTLVLDMLREKIHPTHMNLDEALQAVERIKPQKAIFGHIAHEVDHASMEARLPEKIKLAYDGLVMSMN